MAYKEDKARRFEFKGAYLPSKWWEVVTFSILDSSSSLYKYGFYTKWGKTGYPGSKSKPKMFGYNKWTRNDSVKQLIQSKLKKGYEEAVPDKTKKAAEAKKHLKEIIIIKKVDKAIVETEQEKLQQDIYKKLEKSIGSSKATVNGKTLKDQVQEIMTQHIDHVMNSTQYKLYLDKIKDDPHQELKKQLKKPEEQAKEKEEDDLDDRFKDIEI